MYKILIVDDFAPDRAIMRDIIQSFNDLDLEICGESENGLQALEMARKVKPDIILSDIEMPIMNGFQLARAIRKELSGVRMIYCSMYSEFKYAREALYLDSYGYVLKPIEPIELKESIMKVSGSISNEIRMEKENENLKHILEENKLSIIENFVKNIVYRIGINEGNIWETSAFFGLKIKRGHYILALVEIDDYEEITGNIPIEKRQLLSIRVYENIKKSLKSGPLNATSKMDDSHCLVLFSIPEEEDFTAGTAAVNKCCERTVAEFCNSDISISMAVSSSCDKVDTIGTLYDQCKYIIRFKYSLGKGKVIYHSDIPSSTTVPDIDFNNMQKELRFLVNSGSSQEIDLYIEKLFSQIPVTAGEQYMKNLCFCVVMCLQIIVYEQKDSFKDIFNEENLLWEKLLKFETILDAKNWIKNILVFVNGYFAAKAASRGDALVRRVKEHVHSNLLSEINLEIIAGELYYTSSYLNRVFKQKTGETILDYITKTRMEKAKELLEDPRVKLYEVAQALGYSHTAYFGNVFKKFTGLTPKEYRERCR